MKTREQHNQDQRDGREAGLFHEITVQRPGYRKEIGELIKKHEPKSILDYGCGSGEQYSDAKIHEEWGVPVPTQYDPGVEEWSDLPDNYGVARFDGVICIDAFEHIPLNLLGEDVMRVFEYAKKFLYITIATRPGKKNLPCGENTHCTVMPASWWEQMFSQMRYIAGFTGELQVRYT